MVSSLLRSEPSGRILSAFLSFLFISSQKDELKILRVLEYSSQTPHRTIVPVVVERRLVFGGGEELKRGNLGVNRRIIDS